MSWYRVEEQDEDKSATTKDAKEEDEEGEVENEELKKERDAEVKKLTMSLEDRMTEFRAMLLEKGVSLERVSYSFIKESWFLR